MAITFKVEMKSFPDNDSDDDIADAILAWLNVTLTVTTVYEISVEHHSGFWKVIILYV